MVFLRTRLGEDRAGWQMRRQRHVSAAQRVPDPCQIKQSATVNQGARRCRHALTGLVLPYGC